MLRLGNRGNLSTLCFAYHLHMNNNEPQPGIVADPFSSIALYSQTTTLHITITKASRPSVHPSAAQHSTECLSQPASVASWMMMMMVVLSSSFSSSRRRVGVGLTSSFGGARRAPVAYVRVRWIGEPTFCLRTLRAACLFVDVTYCAYHAGLRRTGDV